MRRAALAAALLGLAAPAQAQDLGGTAAETAREQSCKALYAGTVGAADEAIGGAAGPTDGLPVEPAAGIPETWAVAPAELGLPERIDLRSETETFNRRYDFVTQAGRIWVRHHAGEHGPWRAVPLPPCIEGRVAAISVDDDELIGLDDARRIFTMDNALKGAALFSWSNRWGPPFWSGLGYALPGEVLAWSWSVISPDEDVHWTDPAGNHPKVGRSKVSHIWGLRDGGRRLTFWDPWLPLDESYEMCGPYRGRFRAVNLSASGSTVFLVGPRGDLFTRLYDFDLSGHNALFFSYSYEDQRGKGDGAPIQLPAEPWVSQPKIRGEITSAISVHKVGKDAVHRILRVEGRRAGATGYWWRDVAWPAARRWKFRTTGVPLRRPLLANPRRDTSRLGLGRSETRRYRSGADWIDFNVYCSPSRVSVGGRILTLHHVDGLRQQSRSRGLDDTPRELYGALEDGGTFTKVTVLATRDEIRIDDLGWVFRRTQ